MSKSSIKLISTRCPDCGAALSIEKGQNKYFCSYCGASVAVSNENEKIIHKIDDAEIKKADAEKEIRLKELEMEERLRKQEDKSARAAGFMLLGMFVIIITVLLIMYILKR